MIKKFTMLLLSLIFVICSICLLGCSHKHEYQEVVIPATCQAEGYTMHICSCGDKYNDNIVEKLEHSFTNYLFNENATCLVDGTKTAKCDNCSAIDLVVAENTALSHDLTDKSIIKEATCTEKGQEKIKCSRCDYFETKDIDVIDHEYEQVIVSPTCESGGYTTFICDCGDSYIDNQTSQLNHYFINYVEDNNATCETNATKTAKCIRCDKTHTIVIENSALNHDLSIITTIEKATCLEKGVSKFNCSRCNYFEVKDVDATGHNYKNFSYNSQPTCTQNATLKAKCENCDDETIQEIENTALGHSYSTKYLYDNLGHWHKCLNCDETTEIEPHNHVNYICKCGDDITPIIKNYKRVNKNGIESFNGEYVLFGSYPQSLVKNTTVLNALGSYYDNNWLSYNYYIDGSQSNYMKYTDKVYNGEKYRGVYFTRYRPYSCTEISSEDNSYQDDNGYECDTVYWFKYEPIMWRILTIEEGKAFILCESIIDSQQFDYESGCKNNYEESTIRRWLNETFYNTAFNELEKEIIQLTQVDNSARSTNPNNNATNWNNGENNYACENTMDKVFLLSEYEVTNPDYGFESDTTIKDSFRRKKPSDYANSQGAYRSKNESTLGCGYWWLRSPVYNKSNYSRSCNYSGASNGSNTSLLVDYGVVPALYIEL